MIRFENNITEITSIMESKKKLIIPKYQRNYVWDETNIENLFEDFTSFYVDILKSEANPKNKAKLNDDGTLSTEMFFMGSVVIKTNELKHAEIVDGQQRITTMTLIVKAASNFMCDNEFWGEHKNKIITSIENKKTKLDVLSKDADSYASAIWCTEGKINKAKTSHEKVYNAIYAKLEELSKLYDIKDYISKLFAYASVIMIDIKEKENQENPLVVYEIFETLNARGEALEPAHIIKSLLFKTIDEKICDDSLMELWDEADLNSHGKFTDLLRVICTSEIKRVTAKNLYNDISQFIVKGEMPHFESANIDGTITSDKNSNVSKVEWFIKTTSAYAKCNSWLVNGKVERNDLINYVNDARNKELEDKMIKIDKTLSRFKKMDEFQVVKPLILRVLVQLINYYNEKNYDKKNEINYVSDILLLLEMVEIFVFGFKHIMQIENKIIDGKINELCRKISHKNIQDSVIKIKNELSIILGDTNSYIIEFTQRKIKNQIGKYTYSLIYDFVCEHKFCSNTKKWVKSSASADSIMKNSVELEHVFPQTYDEKYWAGTDITNNLVHTIGNMIITYSKINNKIKNKDFKSKYLGIEGDEMSGYVHDIDFINKIKLTDSEWNVNTHWDKGMIIDRAEKAAEIILYIFNERLFCE